MTIASLCASGLTVIVSLGGRDYCCGVDRGEEPARQFDGRPCRACGRRVGHVLGVGRDQGVGHRFVRQHTAVSAPSADRVAETNAAVSQPRISPLAVTLEPIATTSATPAAPPR